MAEPFLGEVRLFTFGFAPHGWAFCDGQILSISQNTALFALVGTYYGGNGVSNFGLPNLQGRVPIHQNSQFVIGELGGESAHTLDIPEIPVHSHSVLAGGAASASDPKGNYFATPAVNPRIGTMYKGAADGPGSPLTITGSGQPHPNMQPFLTLNFCIALNGIFPSR